MSSNSSPGSMTSENLRPGSQGCRTTPAGPCSRVPKQHARTQNRENALLELVEQGFATIRACRVKELPRRVRRAESQHAAKWRITRFLRHVAEYAADCPLLEPVRGALVSLERQLPRILDRWHSLHTNARLEGFNGLFRAARARARGYRNVGNFITMVYLIAAPIQVVVAS